MSSLDKDLALLEKPPERELYRYYAEDEHPSPSMLLEKDGYKLIGLKGITSVQGKPGSGKSSFICVLVSSFLGCKDYGYYPLANGRVLYFDTEQDDSEFGDIQRKIHRLVAWDERKSHDDFIPYLLRGCPRDQRKNFIIEKVRDHSPRLVVIDGVKDLVDDFNNIPECNVLIDELLNLCSDMNVALIAMLHENKGDENMQGHLGSRLKEKCSFCFKVESKDGLHTVKNLEKRHKPLPDWAFTLDDDKIPVPALTTYEQKREVNENAKIQANRKIFEKVFADEKQRIRKYLVEDFMKVSGLKETSADNYIKIAMEHGIIYQDGVYYGLSKS